MKQAYIALDTDVSNAYLGAPRNQQKKLDYIVNSWLKNIFYRKKDPKQKLFDTMEETGREAQANGLTPEILEQILREIKQEMKNENNFIKGS
ncbi:MAG: hypothetical protein FVQ77_06785 [Cytophagales bacterium]|nr:hypothetical protein [Cytophagales bacterium]